MFPFVVYCSNVMGFILGLHGSLLPLRHYGTQDVLSCMNWCTAFALLSLDGVVGAVCSLDLAASLALCYLFFTIKRTSSPTALQCLHFQTNQLNFLFLLSFPILSWFSLSVRFQASKLKRF
ncbi:hypothetical protein BDW66DRAFT_41390 [Aspergillus desertorum]